MRVKGTGAGGESVQHIVVGVVLVAHQLSQANLFGSGEILVLLDVTAVVAQHLNALLEIEDERLVEVFELAAGPPGLDLCELGHGVDRLEDSFKEVVDDGDDLVVVVLDGHFHVEARVFRQVAVRVGVLGAEDGADLEDAAKVGRDGHLLGQLGALGEKGVAAKVVDLEDGGAALGGGGLELGRVDLDEAAVEDVAELARDEGADAEEGLVGGVAQVEDARRHAVPHGLRGLVVGKGGVVGGVDEVDGVDTDLDAGVGGGADRLGGRLERAVDLDERLWR